MAAGGVGKRKAGVLGEGRGGGAAVGLEARTLLADGGAFLGHVVDALEDFEGNGEARNSGGDDVGAQFEAADDGEAEGADEESGLDLGQGRFLCICALA